MLRPARQPFELESNRLGQLLFWPKPKVYAPIEGTSTRSQSQSLSQSGTLSNHARACSTSSKLAVWNPRFAPTLSPKLNHCRT